MDKNSESRIAVIGGDGMLGSALFKFLKKEGKEVFATTRRSKIKRNKFFLDFSVKDSWSNVLDATDACIVGGIVDYMECKTNPEASYVNEECIPELILFLTKNDIRVTYISSNTVFGGEQPWPDENAPHFPGLDYGLQKSNAESNILSLVDSSRKKSLIKIVRLTKILTKNTSPIPLWIKSWEKQKTISAFKDLIFAPITIEFAVNCLANILNSKEPGSYHISGTEDVDYVHFAKKLLESLGYPSSLVKQTTSKEVGIEIPFLPTYSGLGMTNTEKVFGIKSQDLDDVIKYLSSEISRSK